MTNDPELNAMSKVFEALGGLDTSTQQRVVDWVLVKLQSNEGEGTTKAKKSPKFITKSKKRGRKPGSGTVAKRATTKQKASVGDNKGATKRRGRPPGKAKSAEKNSSKTGGRRGRPRKDALPAE